MPRALLTLSGACLVALCTVSPVWAGDATLLGTGVGAALGGVFGSQLGHGTSQAVSTGIGVAVGGLIGNSIGHDMDAEAASRPAYIPDSPPAPLTYNAYTPNYVAPPAPPPTYIDNDAGTYCREFSQEIRIDGRMHESYGTACLQPDGTWRVVQ